MFLYGAIELGPFDEYEYHVSQPKEVSVSRHSLVADRRVLTIDGEIRNDASFEWKGVWLQANVFVDSTLMNSCIEIVEDVPAKSNSSFEIACESTAGSHLPDNFRYEVRVTDGYR